MPKAQVEVDKSVKAAKWGRDPTPEAQERPSRCRPIEGRATPAFLLVTAINLLNPRVYALSS
jgi:hypothetical protein